MVDGVAQGRYAASVGALTVTPVRELKIDFTHPRYTTGFGIAVDRAPPAWLVLLRNFCTLGFLQAVLALGGVLLMGWIDAEPWNALVKETLGAEE